MRGFRSDRANLADTRIAYTFLITIALVCTVMGLLASQLGGRLRTYELERCSGVLSECADSLHAWTEAQTDADRLSAALRFRSAVTSLPEGVDRSPLLTLADAMRAGDMSAAQEARTLADTFALLAAFEYPEVDTARTMIITTLARVTAGPEPEAESAAAEMTQYSRNVAGQVASNLFDGQPLACEPSADGGSWVAGMDNLRLVFSGFDGSLESFVYIRLGDTPEVRCTEAELVERAVRFAGKKLGLKIDGGSVADRLGGFTAVVLEGPAGSYRAVLDSAGRVWSMAKVKR